MWFCSFVSCFEQEERRGGVVLKEPLEGGGRSEGGGGGQQSVRTPRDWTEMTDAPMNREMEATGGNAKRRTRKIKVRYVTAVTKKKKKKKKG